MKLGLPHIKCLTQHLLHDFHHRLFPKTSHHITFFNLTGHQYQFLFYSLRDEAPPIAHSVHPSSLQGGGCGDECAGPAAPVKRCWLHLERVSAETRKQARMRRPRCRDAPAAAAAAAHRACFFSCAFAVPLCVCGRISIHSTHGSAECRGTEDHRKPSVVCIGAFFIYVHCDQRRANIYSGNVGGAEKSTGASTSPRKV